MSFKSWRERMRLSQERVAEMSGLSLRTVQRLEAGHRVSYASLRALAATFEVDVDSLERELYAVRTNQDDFLEVPRWVRLMSDRYWFGGRGLSRRDVLVLEAFCLPCAAVGFGASFLAAEPARLALARLSVVPLVACYLTAVSIRVIDRYKVWPGAENAPAEKPRTWRTVTAEYAYLLGVGLVSIAMLLWFVA